MTDSSWHTLYSVFVQTLNFEYNEISSDTVTFSKPDFTYEAYEFWNLGIGSNGTKRLYRYTSISLWQPWILYTLTVVWN
jgi:hypothetical protein